MTRAYTAEERADIFNRLENNIKRLFENILGIDDDEKKLLSLYLQLTLVYGLSSCQVECVENSYTFNKKGFAKHDIGTAGEVNVKATLGSLVKEPDRSVSITHNHPDSILPSNDDIAFFFMHHILKNTAVCGNMGNLYFMQKGENFHVLIEDSDLVRLYKDLQVMFDSKSYVYIQKCKETNIDFSKKPRNELLNILRCITDIIYCEMCKKIQKYDNGFQFYSERNYVE